MHPCTAGTAGAWPPLTAPTSTGHPLPPPNGIRDTVQATTVTHCERTVSPPIEYTCQRARSDPWLADVRWPGITGHNGVLRGAPVSPDKTWTLTGQGSHDTQCHRPLVRMRGEYGPLVPC